MTDERMREILSDSITDDGGLYSLGWYLAWTPGNKDACLDGNFTAEDLEAVARWMRKYDR